MRNRTGITGASVRRALNQLTDCGVTLALSGRPLVTAAAAHLSRLDRLIECSLGYSQSWSVLDTTLPCFAALVLPSLPVCPAVRAIN